MKKIWMALLSFLLVFTVSSCKKDNVDKFLLEGKEGLETSVELSVEDFDAMMDDDESFAFFVNSSMCNSCRAFKNDALNPFITKTKSVIYQVDAGEIFDSKYEKELDVEYTPTFYVIINGKVEEKEVYDNKNEMFTSAAGLENYLKEYAYLPTLIELSEAQLDAKISNNESFVIYFGWYLCGDCQKMDQRVLNQYLINQMEGKILYYFETHDYITTANTENDLWVPFTQKYHLDETPLEAGKVPTIQVYENGSIVEDFVYANDTQDENNVITKSFYEDLVGQTMTEEELLSYYDEKLLELLNRLYQNA